jgi:hypothetical protein
VLSEKDRRALAGIEQQLERESAALAAVLRGQEGAQRHARLRHDATIVVAGVLAVLCIFLPDTAGAGFMAALLGIVVFLIRRWRFGDRTGKAVEGATGRSTARRWLGRRPT